MPDPSENQLYLAAIDLTGARALVVGGNDVAAEKIVSLRTAGAQVSVVSPSIGDEVRECAGDSVRLVERQYRRDDLDGDLLVIATTGDDAVADRVSRDAKARHMLVNVADVPRLCNFILPAVMRRGPIAIGVSTAGASPALAQRIRSEIEAAVDPAYAELAAELQALREWAKASLDSYERRRRFFDSIVNGSPDPIELLRTQDRDGLRSLIDAAKRDAIEIRA